MTFIKPILAVYSNYRKMPQQHFARVPLHGLLIATGLVLLWLLLWPTGRAQAQSNLCEFQNPIVGTANIFDALVAGGALDRDLIGFHQVRPQHHPGIDVQGDVVPLMRNGGIVRFAGWDPTGGGWGLVLEGVDGCTGVVMEIWHLPDNPANRLPVGTRVDGDTYLGQHGFSGVEAPYLAHNHLTLGFRERPNVNWPMYRVDGIWWVHPGRVADGAAITVARQRPGWASGFPDWLDPWWVLIIGAIVLVWLVPGRARADLPVTLLAIPLWLLTRPPVRLALALGSVIVVGMLSLALVSTLQARGVLPQVVARVADTDWTFRPRASLNPLFHPAVMAWESDILRWAALYNLDPNMVATVMQVESCGNPLAVSSAGAQGLFQVMPFHFDTGETMTEPEINARRGLLFLQATLTAFPTDVGRAFAAYNAGIGGVGNRPYGNWPAETQRYHAWTTGIYADASAGSNTSPTLQLWLQAGGNSLCNSALEVLNNE